MLHSYATLIIAREEGLSGGTAFTKTCAEQYRRPVLVICEKDGASAGARTLLKFLKQHQVQSLNVAGPRESQAPGIGKFVAKLLEANFAELYRSWRHRSHQNFYGDRQFMWPFRPRKCFNA